jgi:succinate dehydrogenase hydrophobic anchor subunit
MGDDGLPVSPVLLIVASFFFLNVFFLNENNFYVEWLVVSQFHFFKSIFFIFQVGLLGGFCQ